MKKFPDSRSLHSHIPQKKGGQISLLLLFILTAFPLSGCTSDTSENSSPSDLDVKSPLVSSSSVSSSSNIVKKNAEKSAELVVIPEKCISCGKCYHIDPEHFIRGEGGKTIVVSQENLDSYALERSIRVCPTDAIVL